MATWLVTLFRRRPGWLGYLLVGTGCLQARLSVAQESAEQPHARVAALVGITLVGPASAHGIAELLEEWFRESGIDITMSTQSSVSLEQVTRAPPDGVRARLWLTLPTERLARVYMADTREQRFLVRDVELPTGLDELGREQLAQVVLASASAFIERRAESSLESVQRTLGPPRTLEPASTTPSNGPDHPSPPSPPPTATARRRPTSALAPEPGPQPATLARPDERDTRGVALAASYAIRMRGDEGVGHGPGVFAQGLLFTASGWTLGAALAARYELPVTSQGEHLDLHLDTLGARVALAAQRRTGNERGVGLWFGGGVDWVRYDPRAGQDRTLALHAARVDARPLLTLAGQHYWLMGSLRAGAMLSLDLLLIRRHYSVRLDSTEQREFTPWALLPSASIFCGWN